MRLNNIIAVTVFLAFAVVPIFADVHTLTVEERLERIEMINVTSFKKIREDLKGLDKSVLLALTEAYKSNARFRREDMTDEERAARQERRNTMRQRGRDRWESMTPAQQQAARKKMRKRMKHRRRHPRPSS